MSQRRPPSPLSLLKETAIAPLSHQAEAERRHRVVSRIDALRAELSVGTTADVAAEGHVARAPQARSGAAREGAKLSALTRLPSPLKWAAAALSVAAALLLYFQANNVRVPLLRVTGGELTVVSATGPVRLGHQAHWEASGDVVVATQAAEASVVLPSQTAIAFAPQTNATIVRDAPPSGPNTPAAVSGESIRLRGGSVTLNVPKLGPRRSLSVVTEHANVVVHGTIFTVMVETVPSLGQRTRVAVQEGEVSVWSDGQERRLRAGREWSSDKAPPALETAPPTELRREEAELPDAGAEDPSKLGAPVRPAISSLARQNQLFESAQAARRTGQHQLALQRFSELMRAYPRSEQAHNARVEHFRLLRALRRHAEARRSAQIYLRVYPRGFATAEARKLVQ